MTEKLFTQSDLDAAVALRVAAAYADASKLHCDGCRAGLLRKKYIWRYVGNILTPFEDDSGTYGHVSTDCFTITQCRADEILCRTPADALRAQQEHDAAPTDLQQRLEASEAERKSLKFQWDKLQDRLHADFAARTEAERQLAELREHQLSRHCCDHCGQDMGGQDFDGHYTIYCHKPGCDEAEQLREREKAQIASAEAKGRLEEAKWWDRYWDALARGDADATDGDKRIADLEKQKAEGAV